MPSPYRRSESQGCWARASSEIAPRSTVAASVRQNFMGPIGFFEGERGGEEEEEERAPSLRWTREHRRFGDDRVVREHRVIGVRNVWVDAHCHRRLTDEAGLLTDALIRFGDQSRRAILQYLNDRKFVLRGIRVV